MTPQATIDKLARSIEPYSPGSDLAGFKRALGEKMRAGYGGTAKWDIAQEPKEFFDAISGKNLIKAYGICVDDTGVAVIHWQPDGRKKIQALYGYRWKDDHETQMLVSQVGSEAPVWYDHG